MQSPSKRKIVFISIIALMALVFFAGFINNYILRPRATGDTVTLNFTPSTGDVGAGDTVDLIVQATSPKIISGATVVVTAENARITDISNAIAVGGATDSFQELKPVEISADGARAVRSVVALQPDSKLTSAIRFQVRFACKAAGAARLSIDTSKTEVIGNAASVRYEVGTAGTGSYNCTSGGGGGGTGPTVNAKLLPATRQAAVGQSFNYDLAFDGAPTGKGFSAVEATLTFNKDIVEVVSVGNFGESTLMAAAGSPGTTNPGAGGSCTTDADCANRAIASGVCRDIATCPIKCDTATGQCISAVANPNPPAPTTPTGGGGGNVPTPTQPGGGGGSASPTSAPEGCSAVFPPEIKNAEGQLKIAYICRFAEARLPKTPKVTITMKGKANGTGTLALARVVASGNVAGDAYTVQPSNAQYTIGAGGGTTGNIKLNLKLKFQGIAGKPPDAYNSMSVRCKLGDGPSATMTEYSTGTFVANDRGIWSGTVAFNAVPGAGYKVLCKGPYHQQKKICSPTPEETYPGSYGCDRGGITLQEGDNNLDFSPVTLLTCDLPTQDFICNSRDLVLVKDLLGRSDAEALSWADVDRNGAVNALDDALIKASFAVRHDEQ